MISVLIHHAEILLFSQSITMADVSDQPKVSDQLPSDPISAVGVVASHSKAPDGFFVVSVHSVLYCAVADIVFLPVSKLLSP